jgi:bla regulator protein BlaR1
MRAAELVALASRVLLGVANMPIQAQATIGETPSANSNRTPAWQTAAGGKMEFEVASIRTAEPGARRRSNVSLTVEDEAIRSGGRFSSTAPLAKYIDFAYKLMLVGSQWDAVYGRLPKWANSDLFTIEAEAPMANPTKDQMRLMMQSLLAQRFNLAVHFETHDVPVMALVLAEPDKLGSRLRPHAQGPPCNAKIPPVDRDSPKKPEVWRPTCGDIENVDWKNNTVILGSRDTSMEMLADYTAALAELDRPVVDQTRLQGRFDYEVNFTPMWKMPKEQSTGTQLDLTGPTFLEALKDQLGLKLKSTRAPIQILVIDHVEQQSPN